MALLKGAQHKLFGGHDGPMSEHRGVVLHVNESYGNLDNWVRDHSNNMSCHFEVYANGAITQYVDTSLASWCQEDGNSTWLSMETEGYTAQPLSDRQVKSCGRIMAFAHRVHGIPLELAGSPGGHGLGTHAMGGAAWGGHPCPGDLRTAQRSAILRQARIILGIVDKPAPPPAPTPPPAAPGLFAGDYPTAIVSPDHRWKLSVGPKGKLLVHGQHDADSRVI